MMKNPLNELKAFADLLLQLNAPKQNLANFDPKAWVRERLGFEPDQWQWRVILEHHPKRCILAPRQSGKSSAVAAAIAVRMRQAPGSTIAVISPTSRQSVLLAEKVRDVLGMDLARETSSTLVLDNRSRLLSLPGDRPAVVRGLTAHTLVVDEASFIKSNLLEAALPQVAATGGDLLILSTPNGMGGFFHDTWTKGAEEGWDLVRVTLDDCHHYDPEVLATLKARLGPRRWAQEMLGEFLGPEGAVFDPQMLDKVFSGFEAEQPTTFTGLRFNNDHNHRLHGRRSSRSR